MNLLTSIPAVWRKRLYALYALAGIVVGALAVAKVNVGTVPDVLAYVGVALGLTAASNVPSPPADGEAGATAVELCVVVIAVIAVLWACGVVPR